MPGNVVLVTVEVPFKRRVSSRRLKALASSVLDAEDVAGAELSVLITDDETVRDLNRRYAGEDKPTDVLSFSLREGETFAAPDAVVRLGDVVISYATAARQAKEAGRPLAEEVDHLLVHGVLHLLGYDHATPNEERRMFARTRELLAAG